MLVQTSNVTIKQLYYVTKNTKTNKQYKSYL